MKQVTEINKIQKRLSDVWSYTEMEMSDFSTVGLKKHLAKISEIVNDVLCDLEELNTCSVCKFDVCDTCLDDMAKEIK
jgi:hypothetical protein